MNTTSNATLDSREYGHDFDTSPSASSAVSWGAIVAGAAAAASLSLILLILGVGLGLSAISPWVNEGISAETFGMSTIIWLTVTQLLSSALGGYLAGRLRTKWVNIHSDEVYFRDTAHGFLSWAIASLTTAVLLTSIIGSILGGSMQAGASVLGNLANTAAVVAMPADTSEPSGMSTQEVENRMADIYTRAAAEMRDSEGATKEATEAAREASAYAALWIFVALLIGAFAASLAATLGGKQRDATNIHHQPSL